jgi:hypothetical protein
MSSEQDDEEMAAAGVLALAGLLALSLGVGILAGAGWGCMIFGVVCILSVISHNSGKEADK